MKKKFSMIAGVLVMTGLLSGCLTTALFAGSAALTGAALGGSFYSAQDHFNRGAVAYNKKQWGKAITEFTKTIKKQSNYYEAYVVRGWAYLYKGNSKQAEKDFNAALRIKPGYDNAKDGLGHIGAPHAAFLLVSEGNNAMADGKSGLAIEKYSRAIALYADYSSAYNNRGYVYLGEKRYDEAEADFKEAVKVDPENKMAYANLGAVYKYRKDYEKAEEYLKQALKIDASYAPAKDELAAIVKEKEGKAAEEKALKAYELATAYLEENDYTNAVKYYREALKHNPKYTDAQKALEKTWEKRIAKNPNPYPAPFNGAWKYFIPASADYMPAKTETRYRTGTRITRTPERIYDGYHYNGRWVDTSRTVTRTYTETYQEPYTHIVPGRGTPELTIIYEFNGKSFKSNKGTSGTFYYDGDRIELEDGTVMRFSDGVITDEMGKKYTKQ
jgi:tetratricopeptide (TPR) repeat protein